MFLKTGEVDIIEGVHDNEHNQVTFHTAPGISDFFLPYGCSYWAQGARSTQMRLSPEL